MSESPSETPEHPTGPGDPPRDLHGGGESVSRAVSGETIESGDASSTDASDDGLLGLPPVRYPNAYVWYVFLSTMDILFTWMILTAGGREVNPVAQWFLDVSRIGPWR